MNSVAAQPLAQPGRVAGVVAARRVDIEVRASGCVNFHAQTSLANITTLAGQPVARDQQVGSKAIEL